MVFFMKPDCNLQNSNPTYIRQLLIGAELNQRQAARILGIPPRMMRYYVTDNGPECPYAVQFCLECLSCAQ